MLDYAKFYWRYNLRASARRPLKRSDIQPEFLFILVDQKVYNLKSLENLVTIHVQDVHSYTKTLQNFSRHTANMGKSWLREIIRMGILKILGEHRHTTPSSGLKPIDGSSYLFTLPSTYKQINDY